MEMKIPPLKLFPVVKKSEKYEPLPLYPLENRMRDQQLYDQHYSLLLQRQLQMDALRQQYTPQIAKYNRTQYNLPMPSIKFNPSYTQHFNHSRSQYVNNFTTKQVYKHSNIRQQNIQIKRDPYLLGVKQISQPLITNNNINNGRQQPISKPQFYKPPIINIDLNKSPLPNKQHFDIPQQIIKKQIPQVIKKQVAQIIKKQVPQVKKQIPQLVVYKQHTEVQTQTQQNLSNRSSLMQQIVRKIPTMLDKQAFNETIEKYYKELQAITHQEENSNSNELINTSFLIEDKVDYLQQYQQMMERLKGIAKEEVVHAHYSIEWPENK